MRCDQAATHGEAEGSHHRAGRLLRADQVIEVVDRRAFLGVVTGGLLAAPLAAEAQTPGKTYRIGRLSLSASDARPGHETSDAVVEGLRELGYVEGRDFLLERRDANGIADRLPKLAEELVRIPVDVLLVTGVTATAAARRATGTIPIVCMMGDPVGQGFVRSLAHPGANITGVTLNSGGSDLGGKFLQLLREVLPRLAHWVSEIHQQPGYRADRLLSCYKPIGNAARDCRDS